MKVKRLTTLSCLLFLAPIAAACGDDDARFETRYFFGNVYDGATGQQVTDYSIHLEYFGRRIEGNVNAAGGFELPGVPAYHDYSVFIQAPGYRSFASHNAQFPEKVHENRSFHFEAYLFSTGAQVDDVTFRVKLDDSLAVPSGSIRLRPTDVSSLFDEASEMPESIAGQVWNNDNDLLARTVWLEFSEGQVEIPGAELVFGVPYQVTIVNVPGYQLLDTEVFRAGLDGNRSFVLSRLEREPLEVTFLSTESGNPAPDGTVTLVFNQPVELDPQSSENFYREQLDDNFSINSIDLDDDGETNTLNPDEEPTDQERGTDFTIDGETMQLTWDPQSGLDNSYSGDVIRSITYGGLGAIRLRPVGGNLSDVRTLGDLAGDTSITVLVEP